MQSKNLNQQTQKQAKEQISRRTAGRTGDNNSYNHQKIVKMIIMCLKGQSGYEKWGYDLGQETNIRQECLWKSSDIREDRC